MKNPNLPSNYLLANKIIITTNNNKQFTKKLSNFKNNNSIVLNHLHNYLSNNNIVHYELKFPSKFKNKFPKSSNSTNSSKSQKLNKPIHIKIQKELLDILEKNGKGFNKSIVNKWNKYLPFDLTKHITKYGFTGCKQLYTIFNL